MLICVLFIINANAQLDNSFGNNGIQDVGNIGSSSNTTILETPSGKYYSTGAYQKHYSLFPFVLAYNHDGTPFNAFGNNGVLLITDTSTASSVHIIKQASNGSLYIGYTKETGTNEYHTVIRKIDTLGNSISTFGNNGELTLTSPTKKRLILQDIDIDLQERILLTARYTNENVHTQLFVSRIDGNTGNFDPTFSSGGIDTTYRIELSSVCILQQMQDSSYICSFKNNSSSGFTFTKFKQTGIIDSSFGTNGKFYGHFIGAGQADPSEINDLYLMNDTTLLFGGVKSVSAQYFSMGKLKLNGTLDSTFGVNGTIAHGTQGISGKIVLDNNGNIYVNDLTNYNIHRYLTNGFYDNTFGTAGIVNIQPTLQTGVSRYQLLTDGTKIILSGNFSNTPAVYPSASLTRYNITGTIDNSFGTQGRTEKELGIAADYAFGVGVTHNNQILLLGSTGTVGSNFFFQARHGLIARLKTDGSMEPNFGRSGLAGYLGFNAIHDIVEQADHKILVSGNTNNGRDFTMARLDEDGKIDSTFATNGFTTANHLYDRDFFTAIAQDASGRIYSTSERWRHRSLFRYTATGQGDASFGNTLNGYPGQALLDLRTGPIADQYTVYQQDISVQTDGKPLVSGFVRLFGSSSYSLGAIERWLETGVPDSTFDQDGVVMFDLNPDSVVFWQHRQQTDGKIVVSGYLKATNTNIHRVLVARFNNNGSIDNSFAGNGYTTFVINGFNDQGNTLTLQPDGKIVVMGNAQLNSTDPLNEQYALRLNSNGTLDNTFGTNGILKFSVSTNGDEFSYQSVMDKEGKIILAGYANIDGHDQMFAAKLLTGLTVGIVDINNSNSKLLLYPNPIINYAQLDFDLAQKQNLSIQLLDMSGRHVQTFAEHKTFEMGKHKIDLNFNQELPAGNYVLHLGNSNFSKNVQLIIKR